MSFQESAESLKAKAHLSTIKPPVLLGIVALVLVVVFLVLKSGWEIFSEDSFAIYQQKETSENTTIDTNDDAPATASVTQTKNVLCVHVGGAVAQPGVYELEEGARVLAAIEAAGGFMAEASPETVNLARKLVDGEQIIILTVEEAAVQQTEAVSPSTQASGKININTANTQDLMALPGVGEATAKKIIVDREKNGPFKTPQDLMRVSGIGEKKFADMEPHIAL